MNTCGVRTILPRLERRGFSRITIKQPPGKQKNREHSHGEQQAAGCKLHTA